MTKSDQSATKSMSYLHTVNIKLQKHHRKRSSESIDQRRDTKKINNRHQKKNNHELQYQKHTARVNLSYKSLKKLRKIDRLTFSTFIQLKMKHNYFKSYLHRLSENNSNKCYEICKARQTSKHLLLNCKHYRAKQLQLKAKA